MIGQLGDAEDAVQEAYARAWQRWNQIGTYADPEGWVRTVAYRIAVSTWRKARTRLLAHGRHGPADDIPALGPEHLDLVEALRTLPPDQRRAVVLHHLVGLTVEEIATEIGAPAGTVKSRLTRGRRALADRLHEEPVPDQPKGG